MRKLIPYLKNYKKESIIGPLFKLLEAVFELIVPLVTARIVDIGIQNRDIPYIWKMAALLVAFGVMGLLCSLLAQYFAAKAAVGFGTELRHDLFCHIEQLSYAAVDKAGNWKPVSLRLAAPRWLSGSQVISIRYSPVSIWCFVCSCDRRLLW